MAYGYRNQKDAAKSGQSGPQYPNLQDSNPLQTVRDTYRQPQEDAYKMQPGRFMPPINPTAVDMISDGRATVRDDGYQPGNQNFDLRSKSFGDLDENLGKRWVQDGVANDIEGRK